jgi:hypothetical protein
MVKVFSKPLPPHRQQGEENIRKTYIKQKLSEVTRRKRSPDLRKSFNERGATTPTEALVGDRSDHNAPNSPPQARGRTSAVSFAEEARPILSREDPVHFTRKHERRTSDSSNDSSPSPAQGRRRNNQASSAPLLANERSHARHTRRMQKRKRSTTSLPSIFNAAPPVFDPHASTVMQRHRDSLEVQDRNKAARTAARAEYNRRQEEKRKMSEEEEVDILVQEAYREAERKQKVDQQDNKERRMSSKGFESAEDTNNHERGSYCKRHKAWVWTQIKWAILKRRCVNMFCKTDDC